MAYNNFSALFLPYCLQKQSDGRYVVLNRRYKPLGFNTLKHIDYEEYPICVKLKEIDSKIAANLSWNGDSNTDSIYLYNDGCIPTNSYENMKNYLKRLEILAKIKFE